MTQQRGGAPLEAVAEVGPKLGDEPLGTIANGFQSPHEEAQHCWLVDEPEAADQFSVRVEPSDAVEDVLRLRQSEDSSREGKAQELDVRRYVVSLLVAHARDRAAFHAAGARDDEERRSECSRWIL